MPNKHYRKGYEKERKFVKQARANGYIAFRSAGSHSPIDVCIIDKYHRVVTFIQSKSDSFPESERKRLLSELYWLSGGFKVKFEVK